MMKWEKIEVVRVVGEEVDWQMTGEMANGSAAPYNGETFFTNVQTGTTNYTHSNVGPIIAGDLNAGDKISMASSSVVNTTETMTYLGVSRPVNVLTVKSSGAGLNGPYNTTTTYIYDKASGMLLENDVRLISSNRLSPIYLSILVFLILTFSQSKRVKPRLLGFWFQQSR